MCVFGGTAWKNHVNLTKYRFVVLCVGTNDSQRVESSWQALFEPLRQLLLPLVDYPDLDVIINTGFGTSAWPTVRAYSEWFLQKLAVDGTGPHCANFHVFD